MRVNRAAVAAKDARTPGYRAAVEAMATGGTDTHYEVPQAAYLELARQHAKPRPAAPKLFAVGDAVEKVLTTVGITKQFVERVTRRPCGCPARQRWLNQAGFKVQRKAAEIVAQAAKVAGFG